MVAKGRKKQAKGFVSLLCETQYDKLLRRKERFAFIKENFLTKIYKMNGFIRYKSLIDVSCL